MMMSIALVFALVVIGHAAASTSSGMNAIHQYNFENGCSYRTVDSAMRPVGVTTATNFLNNTVQDWYFGKYRVYTGEKCNGQTSPNFISVECQTEQPNVGAHNITSNLEYKKLSEKRVLVHTYGEEHINDSSRPDVSEFSYTATLTTTQEASVTQASELGVSFGLEVEAFFATASFQTTFSMSSSETQTKTNSISYEVGLKKTIELAPHACTRLTYNVYETHQEYGWHAPVVAQGVWIGGWNSGTNPDWAGYMVDGHGFYSRYQPDGKSQRCFGRLEPTELDVVVGSVGGASGYVTSLVKREYPLKRDANGNPLCDDSQGVLRESFVLLDEDTFSPVAPSPRNLRAEGTLYQ